MNIASAPEPPSQDQIRLAELSVFNWGSFDGLHTARIDVEGTLITGDNGSGKSTLIDGLMALMLPPNKATFNIAAAQGDKSDRSLLSYMRGAYGSGHDGDRTRVFYKRENATHTALRALFKGDDGHLLTLAALFWITKPTNSLSNVQRLYLIARHDYSLKAFLTDFQGGKVRELKQKLRDDPDVQLFERFEEYRENFQRSLQITNRNAPELLQRALGLKKIDDLTRLIRTLVLEPSRVREDARQIVAEFGDLEAIHIELTDARNRRDVLAPLPELLSTLDALAKDTKRVDDELAWIEWYFAAESHRLLQERIEALEVKLTRIVDTEAIDEKRKLEAELSEKERYADYRTAGGDRIDQCKRELDHATEVLTRTTSDASDWQQAARALGCATTLTYENFTSNVEKAKHALSSVDDNRNRVQESFGEAAGQYSEIRERIDNLSAELLEVESRPDSNVDPRFQRMRDELTTALSLSKSDLPFIGELVDVKEDERDWQGAIERALGGLRTTLVVPESSMRSVTAWINQRHTGLNVRLQVVKGVKGPAQFRADGFLRKLVWQDHSYREWLKHHLSRFDLACVDSTDAFNDTAHALTREGMIQHEKGRFVKNDTRHVDDRRFWSLGFSNERRLALLRRDAEQLELESKQAQKKLGEAREAMDAFNTATQHWQRLSEFKWENIDSSRAADEVRRLTAELARLEQGSKTLHQAEKAWQHAKQRLSELSLKLDSVRKERWDIESKIESANKAVARAREHMTGEPDESALKRLATSIGELSESALDEIANIQNRHARRLNERRIAIFEKKNATSSQVIGAMSKFKSRWEAIAADWGDNDSRYAEDYVVHLKQLEDEDLPALIERFGERLNLHTTQSLANIREKIESERDEIRDRIEVINTVLRRTEFREGSYLRLKTRREGFAHVQELDQRLRLLLGKPLDNDHETRFRQLKEIVGILDKASDPTTAHTLESQRLLDARYQLTFFAEELTRDEDEIVDVLESSSGKSGGEKESFAGTIVAASLAYVLSPPGFDAPVYCTVFLDEAFSNTAEAVSRRVLKVFRELKIHINLITPYKNLNLARESARSLLIAERDAAVHESRLCEVTWEEIDRQQRIRREQLAHDASRYGVTQLDG